MDRKNAGRVRFGTTSSSAWRVLLLSLAGTSFSQGFVVLEGSRIWRIPSTSGGIQQSSSSSCLFASQPLSSTATNDTEILSSDDILEFLDSVAATGPTPPSVLSATPPAQTPEQSWLLRQQNNRAQAADDSTDSQNKVDKENDGKKSIDPNPLLETHFINNEGKELVSPTEATPHESLNGTAAPTTQNSNDTAAATVRFGLKRSYGASASSPPTQSANNIPYGNIGSKPGIGGDGGLVYDVNRLKRNLLQETMTTYKSDLLRLLNSHESTEADITDKLAALVQASPVRTTTDSNLLDGGRWGRCYMSKHTSPRDLQNIYPTKRRQSDLVRQTPASKRLGGKESLWRSHQRRFCLEDLRDHEDAHIVDTDTYVGGLVTKTTRWAVEGLTRTSLRIRPDQHAWKVLGKTVAQQSEQQESEPETTDADSVARQFQFVYSDVDLCIVADAAQDSFSVYTKSPEWSSTAQRRRRKWRWIVATTARVLRKGVPWLREGGRMRATDTVEVLKTKSPVIREIYSAEARLRVLKLGDLDDDRRRTDEKKKNKSSSKSNNNNDDDEYEDEDDAWESIDDPFVHLSADERQQVLKNMRVRDIELAGHQHRRRGLVRTIGRWTQRRLLRKTYFRKPPQK